MGNQNTLVKILCTQWLAIKRSVKIILLFFFLKSCFKSQLSCRKAINLLADCVKFLYRGI